MAINRFYLLRDGTQYTIIRSENDFEMIIINGYTQVFRTIAFQNSNIFFRSNLMNSYWKLHFTFNTKLKKAVFGLFKGKKTRNLPNFLWVILLSQILLLLHYHLFCVMFHNFYVYLYHVVTILICFPFLRTYASLDCILEQNAEILMIFLECYAFYSEKFCKFSKTLFRKCHYPQLLNSSINLSKLFFPCNIFKNT